MYWRKSRQYLVSGGTYKITTELRDRQTTTFDNFLRINQTPQQAAGIYGCTSVSAVDGPVQGRDAEQTHGMLQMLILFLILTKSC